MFSLFKRNKIPDTTLNVVLAGHVDHGKSTFIGRLLLDTESLPSEKLAELKKIGKEFGEDTQLAFITDHLREERERGITIDAAHTFFTSKKRKYCIIDAPGHREFLKNMLTGASQAETALLLVDANEGIQSQTKRHIFLLDFLGIRNVIVLINKMDLVEYKQDRFNSLKAELTEIFDGLELAIQTFIPIAAKVGENVVQSANQTMPWYNGPTVLEYLDSFSFLDYRDGSRPLRYIVQDQYSHADEIVVGKIISGTMQAGTKLLANLAETPIELEAICKFNQPDLQSASVGECVGLQIKDNLKLQRGEVVSVVKDAPQLSQNISANLFWLAESALEIGQETTVRVGTKAAKASVSNILQSFDPADQGTLENSPSSVPQHYAAKVQFNLAEPIAYDLFREIPELGRFVVESGSDVLGAGVIVESGS